MTWWFDYHAVIYSTHLVHPTGSSPTTDARCVASESRLWMIAHFHEPTKTKKRDIELVYL
jgi:hypothetical protein